MSGVTTKERKGQHSRAASHSGSFVHVSVPTAAGASTTATAPAAGSGATTTTTAVAPSGSTSTDPARTITQQHHQHRQPQGRPSSPTSSIRSRISTSERERERELPRSPLSRSISIRFRSPSVGHTSSNVADMADAEGLQQRQGARPSPTPSPSPSPLPTPSPSPSPAKDDISPGRGPGRGDPSNVGGGLEKHQMERDTGTVSGSDDRSTGNVQEVLVDGAGDLNPIGGTVGGGGSSGGGGGRLSNWLRGRARSVGSSNLLSPDTANSPTSSPDLSGTGAGTFTDVSMGQVHQAWTQNSNSNVVNGQTLPPPHPPPSSSPSNSSPQTTLGRNSSRIKVRRGTSSDVLNAIYKSSSSFNTNNGSSSNGSGSGSGSDRDASPSSFGMGNNQSQPQSQFNIENLPLPKLRVNPSEPSPSSSPKVGPGGGDSSPNKQTTDRFGLRKASSRIFGGSKEKISGTSPSASPSQSSIATFAPSPVVPEPSSRDRADTSPIPSHQRDSTVSTAGGSSFLTAVSGSDRGGSGSGSGYGTSRAPSGDGSHEESEYSMVNSVSVGERDNIVRRSVSPPEPYTYPSSSLNSTQRKLQPRTEQRLSPQLGRSGSVPPTTITQAALNPHPHAQQQHYLQTHPIPPNHQGRLGDIASDLLPKRISGWFGNLVHHNSSTTSLAGGGGGEGQTRNPLPSGTGNYSGDKGSMEGSNKPLKRSVGASSSHSTSSAHQNPASNSLSHSPQRFNPLDRILDRVGQYFLDSDSNVDKNPNEIFVLGVKHPGWVPNVPGSGSPSVSNSTSAESNSQMQMPVQLPMVMVGRNGAEGGGGGGMSVVSRVGIEVEEVLGREKEREKGKGSGGGGVVGKARGKEKYRSGSNASELQIADKQKRKRFGSISVTSRKDRERDKDKEKDRDKKPDNDSNTSLVPPSPASIRTIPLPPGSPVPAGRTQASLTRSPKSKFVGTIPIPSKHANAANTNNSVSFGPEDELHLRNAKSLSPTRTHFNQTSVERPCISTDVENSPDLSVRTYSASQSSLTSLALSQPPGSPTAMSFREPSTVSYAMIENPPAPNLSQSHGWPPLFYHDFTSRISLTYRSGFPPIPCSPSSSSGTGTISSVLGGLSASIGRGTGLGLGFGGRGDGLTTDSGWGCMLRTGQSLLANALSRHHLGPDWRRPLGPHGTNPSTTAATLAPQHAKYARLLSWFIDDPSDLCPFSVHRFALKGKELGKEVGEWFGPSTAAGAIKDLTNRFPPAQLGVVVVTEGEIYKSEVYAMAQQPDDTRNIPHSPYVKIPWTKPVLILINLRLGIDGVNPLYYDSVKALFSFPQSVGIAGGRPSSSYYFVGTQANSLFYIDPHHPRPAVQLKQPPQDLYDEALKRPMTRSAGISAQRGAENGDEWEQVDRASSAPPDTLTASPSSSPIDPLPNSETSAPADEFPSQGQDPLVVEDPLDDFFVHAYPDSALRTFHCDKVRKLNIAGLDPSMLVGFLIRDEDEWEDFCARVKQLGKPMFHVKDAPPAWMRSASKSRTPSGAGMGIQVGAKESDKRSASPPPVGPDSFSSSPDDFSEPEGWDDGLASGDEDDAPSHRARESSVEPSTEEWDRPPAPHVPFKTAISSGGIGDGADLPESWVDESKDDKRVGRIKAGMRPQDSPRSAPMDLRKTIRPSNSDNRQIAFPSVPDRSDSDESGGQQQLSGDLEEEGVVVGSVPSDAGVETPVRFEGKDEEWEGFGMPPPNEAEMKSPRASRETSPALNERPPESPVLGPLPSFSPVPPPGSPPRTKPADWNINLEKSPGKSRSRILAHAPARPLVHAVGNPLNHSGRSSSGKKLQLGPPINHRSSSDPPLVNLDDRPQGHKPTASTSSPPTPMQMLTPTPTGLRRDGTSPDRRSPETMSVPQSALEPVAQASASNAVGREDSFPRTRPRKSDSPLLL